MKDGVLIVSLHDVHPGSLEVVRRQVGDLREAGLGKVSMLVVPEFHHGLPTVADRATVEFLDGRAAQGDDLVLHGYYHDRIGLPRGNFFWTRIYSNDEAEFFEMEEAEAERRLRRGLAMWEERGWRVGGFIAPGWLMARGLDGLLRRLGFAFTTRLGEIVRLGDGWVARSQSLCYSTRSWWRIPVSLAWNRWLFAKVTEGAVIRLALHPNDWRVPRVRGQALELVRRALELGYRPMTYQDYVAL